RFGQNVRENNPWSCVSGSHRAGEYKNPSADDGPNSQGHAVNGAQGTAKAVIALLSRLGHQHIQRLGSKQSGHGMNRLQSEEPPSNYPITKLPNSQDHPTCPGVPWITNSITNSVR